jgi:hypothetical protein
MTSQDLAHNHPALPYIPTVLLGSFAHHPLGALSEALSLDGWDMRVIAETPPTPRGQAPISYDPETRANAILSAARSIMPDLMVVAGTDEDAWSLTATRLLRSDPVTQNIGLVLFPLVSVPDDLDITPMSGPDAWVFLDARMAQAVETVRRAVRLAIDGRLEWAQRDWTAEDRRHNSVKSLQIRIEHGRPLDPESLADMLFGPRCRVDVHAWDNPMGWRYGAEDRYQAPLLIRSQKLSSDESGLEEHRYTMHSRNARILIAAAHASAELAGGWPSLESYNEQASPPVHTAG